MTRTKKLKPALTKTPEEYATFSAALKKVLTVSHDEMKTRIDRASLARASRAKH
jgi:hypothetical protein